MLRLSLAFWLLLVPCARAHPLDHAQLEVDLDAADATVVWRIAARALAAPLALDADADGTLRLAELREVVDYAETRLELSTERGACALADGAAALEDAQLVVRFRARCPAGATSLRVRYDPFFELDDAHRGFLRVRKADRTETAVFTAQRRSYALSLHGQGGPLRTVRDYLVEGVLHIWLGFDHLLFLLTLLLPILLPARPPGSARATLGGVVRVVTAFTLAHSLTLVLAALALVRLPSRLVESLIALSVMLAALHNLRPIFPGRGPWVAFGFGLVHGFGFASVLAELGLPQDRFALALAAFNVGVELGQLAVVAPLLPLARLVRAHGAGREVAMRAGSIAVVAIAGVWLVERALDLSLWPEEARAARVAPADDGTAAADRALREGKLSEARAGYIAALARSAQASDAAGIARQHHNLAAVARAAGDASAAGQALRRALEVEEAAGQHAAAARDRIALATLYRHTGQLDEARSALTRAVEVAEQLGREPELAEALGKLGLTLQLGGMLEPARAAYARAIDLDEARGRTRPLATNLANDAWVARALGARDEARTKYARALALFEQLGRADEAERVRMLLSER